MVFRYARRDVTAVGNFTANLSNVPRDSKFPDLLNSLLQKLVTKVSAYFYDF